MISWDFASSFRHVLGHNGVGWQALVAYYMANTASRVEDLVKCSKRTQIKSNKLQLIAYPP
jgi:hypothetical protein